MRPPPPEAIHLPFEPGPYRMAMSLVTVPAAEWFELDERYVDDMARIYTEVILQGTAYWLVQTIDGAIERRQDCRLMRNLRLSLSEGRPRSDG